MSKKADKKQASEDAAPAAGGLCLTDHPRAQRQIRRAKGWGGIAAFLLTLWLAHGAGLAFDAALERAIPAAIAGYALVWAAAVVVWRHLAQAEIEVARLRLKAMLEAADKPAENDAVA